MIPTLLLGLDGATFDVLDPLMTSGVMPRLRRLVEHGVRAPLRSTVHPLTPPAWTTAVTGRTPGNHGVFDFVRVEERDAGMYFTLTDARDVAVETIWQIASCHGAQVVALNLPAMFPARPVNGFVVPGLVPWRHLRRYTYPPELFARISALPGFDLRELAMDYDQENRTVQGLHRAEMPAWVDHHLGRERQWSRILDHLLATTGWQLAGINFDGNDKLLHLFWRLVVSDGAGLEPWEQDLRARCLRYYRELDRFLGNAVELAGLGARVFIVSDHGFGPSNEVFYANAWLASRGYLHWTEGARVRQGDELSVERLKIYLAMIDWDRTAAHVVTPSSNGVRIRVAPHRGHPGVRPEDYLAFRERLAAELLSFRAPDGGQVVTAARSREVAYPGACSQAAPDLLLTLRDGGFVSILASANPVEPRSEIVGTHRPEGVFIGWGAGLRQGIELDALDIADVAPTLLYSLGVPVPEDLEGEVAIEAFSERQAPQLVAAGVGGASRPEGEVFTAEEEAEVVRRLSELGYL